MTPLPKSEQLDLAAIRARLAGAEGPRFWQSLEELAETGLCERERGLAAAAEVVESERDVAEPSESISSPTNVVVLSSALVHQQHARPIAATKLVIDREVADHGNTKCFVLDPIATQHFPDVKC